MLQSLYNARMSVIHPGNSDAIQSVAGFASLHVGIILTLALIVQYTVRHVWLRRLMWVYFALTVVSTLYFGWHYISDDIAGAGIAWLSVWLGAQGHRAEVRPARAGLPPDDLDGPGARPRARGRRPRGRRPDVVDARLAPP